MEVLALEGSSNCGKSETLNIVYQLLLFDGYTQIPGHFTILGNPKMKDFRDVLIKNNNIIGIVTQGDYVQTSDAIIEHLNKLSLAGCSKVICACTNKSPKARLQVMQFSPHTFFPKTITLVDSLVRIINNTDAQTIFNAI